MKKGTQKTPKNGHFWGFSKTDIKTKAKIFPKNGKKRAKNGLFWQKRGKWGYFLYPKIEKSLKTRLKSPRLEARR